MFEPIAIPSDAPAGLRGWLKRTFSELAVALARPEVSGVRFTVLHEEPERIEDGDQVVADGTDWNPGAGAGAYLRVSGAWVKL